MTCSIVLSSQIQQKQKANQAQNAAWFMDGEEWIASLACLAMGFEHAVQASPARCRNVSHCAEGVTVQAV